MTSYKEIFGLIAAVLGVIGYIPYVRDTFRGKTKPHAFTWLVVSVTGSIIFAAQVFDNGGAGAWLTAVCAAISFLIFFWALAKGDRKFALFDWICLGGAFAALAAWVVTGNPLISVILITLVDIFGMMPLLRHGYYKPHEETASMFAIYFFAWIFSLLALDSFTVITALNPAYAVVMNVIVVTLLLVRRRQQATGDPTLSDMRERASEALAQRKEEHFKKIEAYVREKGSIDNEAVRQLLGVSQSTATNYLTELANLGRLKKHGMLKSARYTQ